MKTIFNSIPVNLNAEKSFEVDIMFMLDSHEAFDKLYTVQQLPKSLGTRDSRFLLLWTIIRPETPQVQLP